MKRRRLPSACKRRPTWNFQWQPVYRFRPSWQAMERKGEQRIGSVCYREQRIVIRRHACEDMSPEHVATCSLFGHRCHHSNGTQDRQRHRNIDAHTVTHVDMQTHRPRQKVKNA